MFVHVMDAAPDFDAQPLPALPVPRLAFVDVETTGTAPPRGRITEVAVVSVEQRDDGHHAVRTWSTLVDPGTRIPPEIRFLTGIDDAMVAGAPPFAAIADALLERLGDAVLVAHHARFDYGFLKAEFARAGRAFQARTLCTVRLSRALDPDRSPHTLDALIHRHRLPCVDRHRALGDARVLWAYLRHLLRTRPATELQAMVRRLLRHPGLPSHLPADLLEQVPVGPGVYRFLGLGGQPLYVGQSRRLRQRIAAHFSGDHASERGLRLASETRDVRWQATAGALGARLAEIAWIGESQPSHNAALRRTAAVFVEIGTDDPRARIVAAEALGPQRIADGAEPRLHGPFTSRPAARAALLAAAAQARACLRACGLERGRDGMPCFQRQLGRCAGACVGLEARAELAGRLREAMSPHRTRPWPWPGAIELHEHGDGGTDCHRLERWCWLEPPVDGRYDPRIHRLLADALAAFGHADVAPPRERIGDLEVIPCDHLRCSTPPSSPPASVWSSLPS